MLHYVQLDYVKANDEVLFRWLERCKGKLPEIKIVLGFNTSDCINAKDLCLTLLADINPVA